MPCGGCQRRARRWIERLGFRGDAVPGRFVYGCGGVEVGFSVDMFRRAPARVTFLAIVARLFFGRSN
jgi:hypothetical protein